MPSGKGGCPEYSFVFGNGEAIGHSGDVIGDGPRATGLSVRVLELCHVLAGSARQKPCIVDEYMEFLRRLEMQDEKEKDRFRLFFLLSHSPELNPYTLNW